MISVGTIKPVSGRPFVATQARKRTRGASPVSERTRQPWAAIGLSKRTYYRRKALGLIRTQHDAAHVAAWFATLSGIARLEHRSLVRRCLIEASRAGTDSREIYGLYVNALGAS